MYIYTINIWQQQNYTFIYRFKTINNINMFILYIKKKYKVYTISVDKQTKKGIKRSENVYKLYQLIDLYGINNLIFGKLHVLYPESKTILYVNYI